MNLFEEVKSLEEELIKHRRNLHRIPETGLHLPETKEYIKRELESLGLKIVESKTTSGIMGILENGSGKVLAVRSDMDALPIKEQTGLPFASTNGNMHACGHDAHMAIVLTVAKILKNHRERINGVVKFIFQPGEEKEGGAKYLVEEGFLKEPDVDVILGIHVGNFIEEIDNGQIGLFKGPFMASLDRFTLTVEGKGTHGATPHKGIDPITISSYIINGFQSITSRENEVFKPLVISIGKIKGGTAYNVIPDIVEIEGTVRTLDEETRRFVAKRMEEVSTYIARSFRGESRFTYHFGYPVVVNDEEITEDFYKKTLKVLPESDVVFLKKPTMVGEDFSYYLKEVKGTYFFLSSKGKNPYPHHNPKFDIDESVLWKGVLSISNYIMETLG